VSYNTGTCACFVGSCPDTIIVSGTALKPPSLNPKKEYEGK